MKRLLTMFILGVILSTSIASSAFAEYVYKTKFGKKYHHSESRFIKDREDVEKITVEEAEDLGLEPSRAYLRYKDSLEGKSSDSKK